MAKLYQAKVRFVPRRVSSVSRASASERDREDRLLGGVISLDARTGTREEGGVEEEEKEEEEVEARSRGLREGIGDAQSRVSFPSPASSPEGTISSGTESAREPGRGDPRIPPLFQLLPCLICANFVQYVAPLRRLDSPVLSVPTSLRSPPFSLVRSKGKNTRLPFLERRSDEIGEMKH